MCNAHNHSPECTCGFGGEGHSGGSHTIQYLSNATKNLNEFLKSEIANPFGAFFSFNSFVNPNATCPVCGDSVFYYQCPNGGKVYFDALGPPWPKHPCIINKPIINFPKIQLNTLESIELMFQDKVWHPFIVKTAYWEEDIVRSKYVMLNGVSTIKTGSFCIYIENSENFPSKPSNRIFFLRDIDHWSYEVSSFLEDENRPDLIEPIQFKYFKYKQDIINHIIG
jgi:hypothetical protein